MSGCGGGGVGTLALTSAASSKNAKESSPLIGIVIMTYDAIENERSSGVVGCKVDSELNALSWGCDFGQGLGATVAAVRYSWLLLPVSFRYARLSAQAKPL